MRMPCKNPQVTVVTSRNCHPLTHSHIVLIHPSFVHICPNHPRVRLCDWNLHQSAMSKKRHPGDPNEGDSTESGDDNQNSECSHVKKAVDLQRVKKALIKGGVAKECEQCKRQPQAPFTDPDIQYDNLLWLCLRCGNQGCGRDLNQHALKHYNTPTSDSHAICVDTRTWQVWCYECDNFINSSCKKKLQEAVEYLQRTPETKNYAGAVTGTLASKNSENMIMDVVPVVTTAPSTNYYMSHTGLSSSSTLPRPRGLTNLGNTCFFNSVMQCLAQTPYLLELLNETSQPGQDFRLPGGLLNPNDDNSIIVEPLEGKLEKWRVITSALAETISELQNRAGRYESFVPRTLFSRLANRMPQFGGGDQHDSHELLRHLLEAAREEDLRRYQSVILDKMEKLGLSSKTVPSTVEGDKKKIIKFYGQQASEMLLPTEQVFRGVLVSTLQCQECQHTSHIDEFFLDLSLPITEKQVPPVLRRKAEDIEDNKPSKYQIKKEKRAERKKTKKQKAHIRNATIIGPQPEPSDVSMENKSESESDADVEDNIEVGDDVSKGMESGYNSDKVDNSSPDGSNNRSGSPEMTVDDSGVPSPAIIALPDVGGSHHTSPASSETNIDMGSPLGGQCSPEEDANEYCDRPESRLSFVNNKHSDLKRDLAKLSLLNDGDSSKVNSIYDFNMEYDQFEGACGGQLVPKVEKMEEDDEDADQWTNTMSARYQCEEGEYSVQSCLNQFTACELMTGSNKVSCEVCTKRHGGADRKTVYTNTTKQLLIYNPPAVLILHLKRFQVLRFRSAKVSKMVKFPTLLDLAPFCSKRSQTLPTFEAGQTKVLYSLYGVVEHSGSLHGGHYVAYVKVRPKLDEHSYRWQFLPKNQRNQKEAVPKGALGEPETPAGKWYYISDSHVAEVTETKVLSAQAYLLFYERIL